MYTVQVDPHTHTIFSGHAFSTIGENAAAATKAGLLAIGMSEHYGPTCTEDPFGFGPMMNMPALPRGIDGVTVLASVEIDIVDFKGHLGFWDLEHPFFVPKEGGDFNSRLLDSRDYAIASVHHFKGMEENTVAKNTEMYCRVLEDPRIHIIGHPGRAPLRFDIKEVCKTAKAHGKMLEINDHSFDSKSDVTDECRRIAECCAELGVLVSVGSDAHSAWFVGQVGRAVGMLEEIGFPPELIANRTLDGFLEHIKMAR